LQAIFVAALLLLASGGAFALEIKAPKISIAAVDWETARAALNSSEAARRLSASAAVAGAASDLLARLNQTSGTVFPNIAASSVPVLLPFDLDAFLRHNAGEDVDYFAGFGAPKFFLAGPAGYSATFSVALETGTKTRDVDIDISGFGLLYELGERVGGEEKPPMGLQTEFPGIRRFYLESHMRYLFTRHGVLYDVSVGCFDGSIHSIRRLSCQDAHGVVARLLKALSIAGGAPQAIPAVAVQLENARPTAHSAAFSYYPPGALISGTGARNRGGDPDYTVYAAIRFPIAEAPVQTYSQMFINLGDCTAAPGDSQTVRRNGKPFRCAPGKAVETAAMPSGGQNTYPWRDNFCERRAFFVGQCPSGLGHQGEDIVPVGCALSGGDSDQCDRSHHRLVAVHDGVVLRAPQQEGLVVVTNEPGMHARFRYLHMNPKAVDEDGWFSGRAVRQGEVIGRVSNFNGREGGTSYHLHFDIHVPTKDGWVLVNPYMTLVSAYERLIGSRGTEIQDELGQAAQASIIDTVGIPSEYRIPDSNLRKNARKKHFAAAAKHKKQH
jgi:murein DD-endopeptidase MepM/ murein hydrolase activator NlpD